MALKVASGSYTGNATDNRAITGLGFQPKMVLVCQDSGSGGASSLQLLNDSDESHWYGDNTAFRSNQIQGFDSDGFTIGTEAQVNSSGVNYHWFALGGDDADIYAGSYSGNGSDNRSITGVGFEPEMVWLYGSNNSAPACRFGAQTGDNSFRYGGVLGQYANAIQAMESDGFQLGNVNEVNAGAATYYYVAVRNLSDAFVTGSYTGDGVDDRGITGIGFEPELVLIHRDAGGYNSCWTSTGHGADDTSINENSQANAANLIQSLDSDGFTIGTAAKVNSNSTPYFYMAARTSPTGGGGGGVTQPQYVGFAGL